MADTEADGGGGPTWGRNSQEGFMSGELSVYSAIPHLAGYLVDLQSSPARIDLPRRNHLKAELTRGLVFMQRTATHLALLIGLDVA